MVPELLEFTGVPVLTYGDYMIIVGIILAGLLVINQFPLSETIPASDVAEFSSEQALDHLKVIAKEPPSEIKAITLHYLIDVNNYLVKTGDSYILIDTGFSTKRTDFEKELESAGVRPGNLKLIILTHGDFDHTAMPPISIKSLVQK